MREKILAVDDDPDILDASTMILESRGYQVVLARNGLEALTKVKTEKPDLMILDLLMPKMDGFEVYKELQNPEWSKYKDMPILILTSQELGVDDYLEKPFSPDILLERVEKLINKGRKV